MLQFESNKNGGRRPMKRFRILIIAPYLSFQETAAPVIQEFPTVDFEMHTGDEFTAISIFNSYPPNAFDAIITRGAIAAILRQFTSVPVVEVDVSLLDILRAINQPGFSDQRVAVVGYSSIINSVKKVFEVLQLKNTEIYEVRYAEVKERVAELADRGFSLIIGDVPSVNAAMANGLRGLLILSSEDCIRQSVIAAIYYSELMEKGQEITQIFQTVIDNLKFRIILMDQIGNVIVDNRAFEITDHQTFKKELLLFIPVLLQQSTDRGCKKIGTQGIEIIGKRVSYRNQDCFLFFISLIHKGYASQADITIEKPLSVTLSPEFINTLQKNNPRVQAVAEIVTASVSPPPVLILGEYGTGKSSLAYYLHGLRKEPMAPFIFVRCNLLTRKRWNAFLDKTASPLNENGCTLYLENIHLLPIELQQELSAYIVDSAADQRHFIIASATNRIHHLLSNDQFLYPLYQKISSLHVILAPLREFPDSITDFSQIFLTAANQEYQKSIRGFEEGVVALLEQQHWNTNLSQLKTFIQQLVLTAQGAQITLKEAQTLLLNDNTIPPEETEYLNYSGIDITKPLEEIERDIIQHVLMEENMNQSAAARRLGISRNTIWRKLHA
ncbi:MAG: sigma-54-dependent transcriptional regulator [Oscillibacter sp.]|nr:sigma-54-dependent transcriptional regulator [Oscillibacter sp.]